MRPTFFDNRQVPKKPGFLSRVEVVTPAQPDGMILELKAPSLTEDALDFF